MVARGAAKKKEEGAVFVPPPPLYSRRHVVACANYAAILSNLSDYEHRRTGEAMWRLKEASRMSMANLRLRKEARERWKRENGVRSEPRRRNDEGLDDAPAVIEPEDDDDDVPADYPANDDSAEERNAGDDDSSRDDRGIACIGTLPAAPPEPEDVRRRKEREMLAWLGELWECHRGRVDRFRSSLLESGESGPVECPPCLSHDGMPPTAHVLFGPDDGKEEEAGGNAAKPKKSKYNAFYESDIGVAYYRRDPPSANNANSGGRHVDIVPDDDGGAKIVKRRRFPRPGPKRGRVLRYRAVFPLTSAEVDDVYAPLPYSVAVLIKVGNIESQRRGRSDDDGDNEDDDTPSWDCDDVVDFCYYSEAAEREEGKKPFPRSTEEAGPPKLFPRSTEEAGPDGKASASTSPGHRRRNSAPPKIDCEMEDFSCDRLGKEKEDSPFDARPPLRRSRSFVGAKDPSLRAPKVCPYPPSGPTACLALNDLLSKVRKLRETRPSDIEPLPTPETHQQRYLQDFVAIFYNAALVYHRSGNDGAALRMFDRSRRVLTESEDDGGGLAERGAGFLRDTELKDAAVHLLVAQGAQNMGQIHAYHGRHADAFRWFTTALTDARAAFKLSFLTLRRREVFDALESEDRRPAAGYAGMLVAAARCVSLAYFHLARTHFVHGNAGPAAAEAHNALDFLRRFLAVFPLDARPGKPFLLPSGLAAVLRRDISLLLQSAVLTQRGFGGMMGGMSAPRAFRYVGWTHFGLPPSFTREVVEELGIRWAPPSTRARTPPAEAKTAEKESADGGGRGTSPHRIAV